MKAWQKRRLTGSTTGCCSNKDTCIQDKQRVRQPAVRYTQQNITKKEQIYTHRHTSMHVGMYDCMRSESESELGSQLSGILRKANKHAWMLVCVCVCMCLCGVRANQRHTRHHRSSRVCEWSLHVCARACACWHYFANISTVSVCLPVHTVTQKHTHTSNTKILNIKTQILVKYW